MSTSYGTLSAVFPYNVLFETIFQNCKLSRRNTMQSRFVTLHKLLPEVILRCFSYFLSNLLRTVLLFSRLPQLSTHRNPIQILAAFPPFVFIFGATQANC